MPDLIVAGMETPMNPLSRRMSQSSLVPGVVEVNTQLPFFPSDAHSWAMPAVTGTIRKLCNAPSHHMSSRGTLATPSPRDVLCRSVVFALFTSALRDECCR